jgi:hypothetical protein
MKLEIYTVAQNIPPLGEMLILWNIVGSRIIDMIMVEAKDSAVYEIPGKVPNMVWSNDYTMRWSDRWSYDRVEGSSDIARLLC